MRNILLPLLFSAAAIAAPLTYVGSFTPMNGSSVSGSVSLTLDGSILTVNINAFGLEPGQMHPQHIHGRVDPVTLAPLPPVMPPPDLDADGFIETPEGELAFGPPLLPLFSPPGTMNFPTAPGGVINFTETYNLDDPSIYTPGFTKAQLLPLDLRTVEIHGRTLGAEGVPPFEANGVPGYKMDLPVASAALAAVPEPSAIVLVGFGTLALIVRKKKSLN